MYGLYKSLCGNYAKLVEKGVEIYQKHSKQFLEHNPTYMYVVANTDA